MKYIVGIDEVGRGALAGPVVVAAAAIPISGKSLPPRILSLGALKDSKQLSAKKREVWFEYFKTHPTIKFALARVYPRGIERLNISKAANLAAERAYARLIANTPDLIKSNHKVYLDGGLFVGNKPQPQNAKTVIKADEKINAVKVASIMAKVSRDRFMGRLAKKYKRYGFDLHKGYGTKVHQVALQKYGPSDVHRLTFLKVETRI